MNFDDIYPSLTLSFSAGIVLVNQNDDISSVLKQADENLYRAKSSGRNQIVSELG